MMFTSVRFDLYQRPSSEEACSILLPILATVVTQCGKKFVVRLHIQPISCHVTSLLWQELEKELELGLRVSLG